MKIINKLSILFLSLLLTAPAFAANIFEPPAGDKSMQWFINVLFPADLASSPLSGVLGVFNSALLMLGGILAAYTMVAGTMATAHDGEMMGKKWSSMWIPIRTAIGTAAILPVKGGFCLAQMIVIWLTVQGIGLASAEWNQYAANPADGAVIAPNANTAMLGSLAQSMFKANVCTQTYSKYWEAVKARGEPMLEEPPTYGISKVETNKYVGLAYGITKKAHRDSTDAEKQVCGLVTLAKTNADKTQDVGVSGGSDPLGSSTGAGLSEVNEGLTNSISQAHNSQMEAMNASMAALATQYLANVGNVDLVGPIDGAIDTYKTTVESAVKSTFGTGKAWDSFKANIQADGWIMAGAWNMKLIRIQDSISQAVNRAPEYKIGSEAYKSQVGGNDVVEPMMIRVSKDLTSAKTKSKYFNGMVAQSNSPNQEEKLEDGSQASAAIGELKSVAGEAIANGLKQGNVFSLKSTEQVDAAQINPLLQIKALGASLGTAGWILLASAGIIGALLGGGTTMFGNWLQGFGILCGIVMPISISLWVTGETLEVVIPMLPYVMFFGVVFGWMLLVIEAVFAAPLWAVAHMHPDADGVVGKGGQGYMLILSLTLRPALIILGLIAANTIMPIAGAFINSTFFGAFSMMNASGFNSPMTLLAMIGVYCGLMFTLVKKCMSLIYVIPDHILQWIGGHHSQQLGQHAEGAMGGVEKIMLTQTALNQTAQTGAGFRGAMAAARGHRQEKQQAEANKLSNIGNANDRTQNAIRRASDAMGKDKDDPSASYAVSAAKGSLKSAMDDQKGIMDSKNYSKEQRENASEQYNEMKQAYDALDGNYATKEEPPKPRPSGEIE